MLPAYSSDTIDDPATIAPFPEHESSSASGTDNIGMLRKVIVMLVILAVVGGTAWKINSNLAEQPAPDTGNRRSAGGGDRAVPVAVSRVEQKTMPIFLPGLGTVTAYNAVTIKSRVDGQLIAVNVREGQQVHKGQLIAQIDPEPYAAALAQAEGQLARDKSSASYTSAEADRYTALFKAGVIAQNSQQLQVANAGQSAGSVETDMAAIRAARVNLAYTRIISPVDGVVGLRQVDPGNIVRASDTNGLMLITQVQPISVIFTLPEDQLPQVQQVMRKKEKLVVEAYDRSQTIKLATGSLLTLDNIVDITTGTDKAKAVFDNKDASLFPNQFVNVRLIMQQRENALVIPAASIQTGSQGNFVYVMKKGDPPKENAVAADHKRKTEATPVAELETGATSAKPEDKPKFYVEMRPIVIDVTEGAEVVIGSGLAAGEQVVVDGMEKLKNGSKVMPQRDPAKPGGKRPKGGDSATGETPGAPEKPESKRSKGGGDAAPYEDKAPAQAKDGDSSHPHRHRGQQP